MMAFITSLRHPQNSADYSIVEKLLSDTLASVTNQTSGDYVVLVVGNRVPNFPLPDRVHFVLVDFEPPAPPDGPHSPREQFVRDKGSKIAVGMLYARKFNPDYIMIFDADDFVSNSLVEWATTRPGHDGWYIDKGFIMSSRRGAFRAQDDFNRTCGTCLLVAAHLYSVPDDLDVHAPQGSIISGFGETLWRALGAHRDAVEWFESRGASLTPLPFRGAIYHVGTGENHSGKDLVGLGKPISRQLVTEFGLTARPRLRKSVWGSWGPRPIAQTMRVILSRAITSIRSSG